MVSAPGSRHSRRLPAIARRLPHTLGAVAAVATTILVMTGLAVGMGVAEAITGRAVVTGGGRFAHTLAAVRAALDLRLPSAAAAWLGESLLLAAAAVAAIVRLVQREQSDRSSQQGRAWGWWAISLGVAACAAELPLGRLVGGLIADATGIVLGPAGLGWWFLVSAAVMGSVAVWAVLSLPHRLGTAAWLGLAGVAWLAAAACVWAGGGAGVVWSNASWPLGAAFACIAALVAARSAATAASASHSASPLRPEGKSQRSVASRDPASPLPENESTPPDGTEFVDGSEDHGSFRHLSKAERKRLKKMARLQRAG